MASPMIRARSVASSTSSSARSVVLRTSGAVRSRVQSRTAQLQCKALLTPPPAGEKKKFITREEEPEEYWSSKGERAGANPFKDPIAIVGIVAIFFPFIFLLVAIATGAVDLSVYR